MKLGVFIVLMGQMAFKDAVEYAKRQGVSAIEIGTGGYPGNAHCNPKHLLDHPEELEAFKQIIADSGLEVSALSCHGNPLHPQEAIAAEFREDFRQTVRLAQELGVKNVVTFSGCPGDHPNAMYPNWVTCPWPSDFLAVLDYQWNEVAIPYWQEEAEFCKQHDVKVAIEPHPGFLVYNTETMLRLRQAVGDTIGCNFDPSHLYWQGADPATAIRSLGDVIYHFHAKDTRIDQLNTMVNGSLDTKPYSDEINRSWIFRTVGYGHNEDEWKNLISSLRLIGYDGVVSIEHEDSLMSMEEGFAKATDFMKKIIIEKNPGQMWWA